MTAFRGKIGELVAGLWVIFTKRPKNGRKKVAANQNLILSKVTCNPRITTKELAVIVEISERKITKNIRKLKRKERFPRVGPNKGGYWEVIAQ